MSLADPAPNSASLIAAAVTYRLITGKDPESLNELHSMIEMDDSLEGLRDRLFSSPEFAHASQHYAPNHKPLDNRAIEVQVHVKSKLMEQMIQRTEEIFSRLGETEPHWAVLTNDKFRAHNIENNKAEFFETGKHNIQIFQAFADRAGIDLSNYRTCLELGCGVGRVTTWLAEIFSAVIACDISSPLLKLTRQSMVEFGRGNVSYMLLNTFAALQDVPHFDVFFTAITLQHNPPPIMYLLLSQMLERLHSGGIALFQLPTYVSNYRFDAEEYLGSPPVGNGIEIHVLPQPIIFGLLEQHGCRLLEMREDGACGPKFSIISNTFFAQKQRGK